MTPSPKLGDLTPPPATPVSEVNSPTSLPDRKYGRNDIDYEAFYSSWMKRLALAHSVAELETMLHGKSAEAQRSARAHLRAIERTGSMQGNSAARAHSRNVTAAAGEAACAIRGAIEIHELFPEFATGSVHD